jgi:hypothetical protein
LSREKWKETWERSRYEKANETGKLTLLLHKGVVESAAYHHKKAVSSALMVFLKDYYLVDPVDHVDSTAMVLSVRV